MKNLSFFKSVALSMFMFAALTACQKEEQSNQVDSTPQNPVATTYEAKVMQQTTNVIVSMLNENPELFNDINEAIKSDAVEYMEDRILFADLFRNPQFAKSVDGQAKHTTFSSEFKKHASANIQYIASTNETRSTALDADALMQYLVDNNISVYCPFPLEDYAEDNRIPAIAANIGAEYEEIPGVQFYADGSYDSVMVSQAYADLHPVWLINPEDDYIFEKICSRNMPIQKRIVNLDSLGIEIVPPGITPGTPAHYEVKFNSIFVTNYYGPITEGELNIYFCTAQSTPIYDSTDEIFKSTFDRMALIPLPRKYVKYAKNGESRGWVAIHYVLEQDWQPTELQCYFAAYEYDKKMDKKLETTLDYSYVKDSHTINAKIALTLEYSEKDDLIFTDRFLRSWMFNKISNSDVTYVDDSGTTKITAPDGYRMIAIGSSPAILVSVKKNIYY